MALARMRRWRYPSSMSPLTPPSDVPRYGEFPHLFWDLAADAPVDIGNVVVLARLLTLGRPEDLRRTTAVDAAAERLPELALPAHVRAFWQRVFRSRDDG